MWPTVWEDKETCKLYTQYLILLDFCNKVGCSQTCFYAKSTSDFSCGCQLGYELGSDSKSCKKAAIGATLYTFLSSSSASSQTLLQLDVLAKYIVEGKATLIDNPVPRRILRISKLAASKEFVYFTDNVNKWVSHCFKYTLVK